MCHLADPSETPPPELGATALPTLRAAGTRNHEQNTRQDLRQLGP